MALQVGFSLALYAVFGNNHGFMEYSQATHLSYLFSFLRVWQGPPPVLARKPSECEPHRDHIIDGLQRFKALACTDVIKDIWNDRMTYFWHPHKHASDGYCVIVRDGKLYDNHQVTFVLALAGHYDRAYQLMPTEWRDSPGAISCKTGLSMIEAQMVFAARVQAQPKRIQLRHAQRRDNERIVRNIRQLLTAFDEGLHVQFPVDELRKLVAL